MQTNEQRINGITATLRETQGPDDTPEKLEEERLAAQQLIETGTSSAPKERQVLTKHGVAEPLTEAEIALKDSYIDQGFPDWSRRDFQQFVKGLETYGW